MSTLHHLSSSIPWKLECSLHQHQTWPNIPYKNCIMAGQCWRSRCLRIFATSVATFGWGVFTPSTPPNHQPSSTNQRGGTTPRHLHAQPNRNVEKKHPQSLWSPESTVKSWGGQGSCMEKSHQLCLPGAPAVSKVRSAATDQINFPQDRLGFFGGRILSMITKI